MHLTSILRYNKNTRHHMQTSYFLAKGTDSNAVSIARKAPWWFSGVCYMPLVPPEDLIERYNSGLIDELRYAQEYTERVLNTLDPFQVIKDLGLNAILLGDVPPGKFCHRRLVANWFEDTLGIKVQEYMES